MEVSTLNTNWRQKRVGIPGSGDFGLVRSERARMQREERENCQETYMKKLRWLQLWRDFGSVVTSTWVSCDTPQGLQHMARVGLAGARKQIDGHFGTTGREVSHVVREQ